MKVFGTIRRIRHVSTKQLPAGSRMRLYLVNFVSAQPILLQRSKTAMYVPKMTGSVGSLEELKMTKRIGDFRNETNSQFHPQHHSLFHTELAGSLLHLQDITQPAHCPFSTN